MAKHLNKNLRDHNHSRFPGHAEAILALLNRCTTIDRVRSDRYTHKPSGRCRSAVIRPHPRWPETLLFEFRANDGRTRWHIVPKTGLYACAQQIKKEILAFDPSIEFQFHGLEPPKKPEDAH